MSGERQLASARAALVALSKTLHATSKTEALSTVILSTTQNVGKKRPEPAA